MSEVLSEESRVKVGYRDVRCRPFNMLVKRKIKFHFFKLKKFILPDIQRLKPEHLNPKALVICGPSGYLLLDK